MEHNSDYSPIDYSSNKMTDADDSGCGSSVCSNNSEPNERACEKSVAGTDTTAASIASESCNRDSRESVDGGTDADKKRDPKCARCQNHGEMVKVKGHKRRCKYKDCVCELCRLTIDRRDLMAKTIAAKRRQKEDIDDNSYKAPEYKPDPGHKKLHFDEEKEYSREEGISYSLVISAFKDLIDTFGTAFGSRLPTDWRDILEEEFASKNHPECKKFLSMAIISVLNETKSSNSKEYNSNNARREPYLTANHSAFKVVSSKGSDAGSQSSLHQPNDDHRSTLSPAIRYPDEHRVVPSVQSSHNMPHIYQNHQNSSLFSAPVLAPFGPLPVYATVDSPYARISSAPHPHSIASIFSNSDTSNNKSASIRSNTIVSSMSPYGAKDAPKKKWLHNGAIIVSK